MGLKWEGGAGEFPDDHWCPCYVERHGTTPSVQPLG